VAVVRALQVTAVLEAMGEIHLLQLSLQLVVEAGVQVLVVAIVAALVVAVLLLELAEQELLDRVVKVAMGMAAMAPLGLAAVVAVLVLQDKTHHQTLKVALAEAVLRLQSLARQ